jgi:predicted transcriptional regulator
MAPRARGRPRGALEDEIIACLAAAGRPLSPADVRAELGDRLAYTTVMTTLARLHAKGALTREEAGRGYVYALQDGPDEAHASMTARRMLRLLQSGRDRESVLARFVADLDEDDERMLAELLSGSGSVDPGIGPGTAAAVEPGERESGRGDGSS